MKKGRPHKPYRFTITGENIDGLRRRKSDERWVIVETGAMFSESDEGRAIARFRRWQARQAGRRTLMLADPVIPPMRDLNDPESTDIRNAGIGAVPTSELSARGESRPAGDEDH